MTASFDAILIRANKTKDGDTITLVAHHGDKEGFAPAWNAHLGSQWKVTMTPLDEHGNAESEVMQHSGNKAASRLDNAQPASSPARAKRSWHELQPSEQAGVLCAQHDFQVFMDVINMEEAAKKLRKECGVKSRADILPGTAAEKHFRRIVAGYLHRYDVVPA